jgi:hypothetical protein
MNWTRHVGPAGALALMLAACGSSDGQASNTAPDASAANETGVSDAGPAVNEGDVVNVTDGAGAETSSSHGADDAAHGVDSNPADSSAYVDGGDDLPHTNEGAADSSPAVDAANLPDCPADPPRAMGVEMTPQSCAESLGGKTCAFPSATCPNAYYCQCVEGGGGPPTCYFGAGTCVDAGTP